MRPSVALYIGTLMDSAGALVFSTLGPTGGPVFNTPVITSSAVPGSVSGGTIIALLDASEIFYADDDIATLSASEQASLQMDATPNAGAAAHTSLWQANLVGVKCTKYANWMRRRDAGVAYIDAIALT